MTIVHTIKSEMSTSTKVLYNILKDTTFYTYF